MQVPPPVCVAPYIAFDGGFGAFGERPETHLDTEHAGCIPGPLGGVGHDAAPAAAHSGRKIRAGIDDDLRSGGFKSAHQQGLWFASFAYVLVGALRRIVVSMAPSHPYPNEFALVHARLSR